jgi:cysteine sulfinate desulfinase/cysteine desulfurase-like protein
MIREKSPEAYIHLDAIQSFLKIAVSFNDLDVDMLSISAHKFGGPKGIGALILSRRFENRNQKICPLLQGSSQQSGLRPGTVPVPLIAAMTRAIEFGFQNFISHQKKLIELRDYFIRNLPEKFILNGPEHLPENVSDRAPQTINFSNPGTPPSTLSLKISPDAQKRPKFRLSPSNHINPRNTQEPAQNSPLNRPQISDPQPTPTQTSYSQPV